MMDLPVGRTRPGDERAFIHRKILSVVSKVAGVASAFGIPGAGTVATITRTVGGRTAPRTRQVPRTQTARPTQFSQAEKQRATMVKFADAGDAPLPQSFANGGACADPGLVMAPDGHCVAPGSGHHRLHFGGVVGGAAGPTGEAVLGIYGAGIRPGSMIIDRAVCGKKMQLGDDGICYNKSQISNKQRMWPAGRKPLLTGGDMRAIAVASRAGDRLDAATARLRKLGMMKKPATSRRPTKAEQQHQAIALVHATK